MTKRLLIAFNTDGLLEHLAPPASAALLFHTLNALNGRLFQRPTTFGFAIGEAPCLGVKYELRVGSLFGGDEDAVG